MTYMTLERSDDLPLENSWRISNKKTKKKQKNKNKSWDELVNFFDLRVFASTKAWIVGLRIRVA